MRHVGATVGARTLPRAATLPVVWRAAAEAHPASTRSSGRVRTAPPAPRTRYPGAAALRPTWRCTAT